MFDVLETLAHADEEMSLTELQGQLQLAPSTLHRLLQALIEHGYAEQNSDSRRYGPGLRVLEVAEAAKRNRRFNLSRIARPFLQQLTDKTGETSNLAAFQGTEVVYIEQIPSPQRVRMFTEVGHRAPLYCTASGKAVLASLPADELNAYFAAVPLERVTSHTVTSPEALGREIARIQRYGFALDNEEFEIGVRCVAASIRDASSRCVGAISISGPTTRMSRQQAEALGPLVNHLSRLCSARIGYSASTVRDVGHGDGNREI